MTRSTPFLLILLLLIATSCAKRPGGYSTQEVRRIESRIGLRITPRDNIYLYREASLWIGTPHRLGGCSTRGIDCSCFVQQLYKSVYQKSLQRNSQAMYDLNCRRISASSLREGDLVFFGNRRSKKIDHVGIYLRNGHFIHTSTSKGVMVSQLSEAYFKQRFISGGRVN